MEHSAPAIRNVTGRRSHIIVLGNEKGGSGKTTAAMHVAVALARVGKRVAAIDLDTRQRSFSRQLENRAEWPKRAGKVLASPELCVVTRSSQRSLDAAAEEETARLAEAFAETEANFDFVIVDTPGSDTQLSRLAHAA